MGDMHAPILGLGRARLCDLLAVLRLLLGNNPLFQVPQYTLVHPLELAIYALLASLAVFYSWRLRGFVGMRKFFCTCP